MQPYRSITRWFVPIRKSCAVQVLGISTAPCHIIPPQHIQPFCRFIVAPSACILQTASSLPRMRQHYIPLLLFGYPFSVDNTLRGSNSAAGRTDYPPGNCTTKCILAPTLIVYYSCKCSRIRNEWCEILLPVSSELYSPKLKTA